MSPFRNTPPATGFDESGTLWSGQDWTGVIEEALGAPVALRPCGPVRSDMHAADVKLKSAM